MRLHVINIYCLQRIQTIQCVYGTLSVPIFRRRESHEADLHPLFNGR